ncbi:hypothetical protein [Herbaspirillum huttiense]|uniref:hypothetical protein n=1 Tax=Herbaspirillum huttiense TaxID=863372 RepID=UPI0031D7F98B
MSDIKTSDLVMIIRLRQCCGKGVLGATFTAGRVLHDAYHRCSHCGVISRATTIIENDKQGLFIPAYRVKKIDPPAEGDSLPTRADLEVTA